MSSLAIRKSKLFVPDNWNGILIIGDCPFNENSQDSPFMHSHLAALIGLQIKGEWDKHTRPALANVLGFYPKNGYFTAVDEHVLRAEANELRDIIKVIQPKVIFALGRQTARWIKPGCTDLDDERGAPFLYDNKIPALLSYHPREIFRMYEKNIVAIHDFEKAFRLLGGWSEPVWNINYEPTFQDVIELLHKFHSTRSVLGVDIETNYHLRVTCLGIAYNAASALVIPFVKPGGFYWSAHEELVIWKLLARVLETCPLVGQNAVHFDHYILARGHKINANFVADTMLAHWEVYCELPKSLAFLNSLYLNNPFWKGVLKEARSGKVPYQQEWLYCGKDAVVTLQAATEIRKEFLDLPEGSYKHYKFNIRVSRAFQYMAIHGCEFDVALRDKRLLELRDKEAALELELITLSGRNISVTSPKQMKQWLYEDLKLPPRYKEVKDEEGDVEMRETQDYLTLLYLARQFPHIPAILVAGRLRKLKKRISSLRAIECRPSTSTIGWNFNVVGTETGRASGYKPNDGWGVQPQNVDARDRDLFRAADDEFWCKADLEGADSWTVAAMLVALGDSRMMNDLLSGVKPAQALAIASIFGQHLITADVAELKAHIPELKKITKKEEAERGKKRSTYDATKAVSHGSNYCMGPQTTHQNIFKKTEGELWVPIEECKKMQNLYESRYPGLFKLRERMVSILNSHGYLDAYSGNRRYFFGRRDNSTVRTMVSQLPQAHTSYATNLLLERLFYWQGNRIPGTNRLIHKPINQVHDETNTLFAKASLDQARDIFAKCSTNRIECWGVNFSIPFEVNYGVNWGECEEELL